jgi:hypothetical protein
VRTAAALVSVLAGLALAACTEVETESATGYEPSKLTPVKGGGERVRVTFTKEGAERVGLETARVRVSAKQTVVPYSALMYDPAGKTYVYTSRTPLSYLREPVEVARIDANRVLLSDGPAAGTQVVTVGVSEVYGTELEVASH